MFNYQTILLKPQKKVSRSPGMKDESIPVSRISEQKLILSVNF